MYYRCHSRLSQEMLEVQAAAPGTATLTVSFTGTGTATNYNCSTYVSIKTWGVEFSESAFTDYNFSPSLGEYGAFGVRIVNAPADATEDFSFKLEIVREIENNGEQHIDWVPVGNGTATKSRPLDFTSNRFDWDGISSVTRSSSNGRDSFQGVAAMPSLAFKVTEDFSVAAGARAIWTKTTIRHQIYSPLQLAYPFPVEHQTEAIGYGYVVSGLYHITDDLDAGLVYRSRVREDSSGTSSGWPNHSYGMDALVTLPDSWEGGLNYTLTEAWEIGCSAIYTGWSSYSDLILEMPGMPPNSASPTGNEINSRKDWKDVWRLGLGTSYALSSSWTVMGGYTYDWSPIQESRADFMMPPGDRHLLGTGLAYTLAPFTLTVGYNFVLMESSQSEAMHSTLGTVYFDHCYAHMVSVSLGANF